MGRPKKELTPLEIQKLIVLSASGTRQMDIAKELGISIPTIRQLQKKHEEEIEIKKDEMNGNPPDPVTPTSKITEKKESKDEKEKKSPYVEIEHETTRKAINKASDSVSNIIAKDTTDDYRASQVLKGSRMKYQRALEKMGIEWDEFVRCAIDDLYKEVEIAYIDEVERRSKEMAQKELEILQAYHEAEISELANEKKPEIQIPEEYGESE